MILYHRTTEKAAASILAEGFKDGDGTYLTSQRWSGVWLSDQPLDINEGAGGNMLLRIDFGGNASELDFYEWVEEGKPYREWLVPAVWVNQQCAVQMEDSEP